MHRSCFGPKDFQTARALCVEGERTPFVLGVVRSVNMRSQACQGQEGISTERAVETEAPDLLHGAGLHATLWNSTRQTRPSMPQDRFPVQAMLSN
eukprot:2618816-Lingulodinium_polyedra.AAC.1